MSPKGKFIKCRASELLNYLAEESNCSINVLKQDLRSKTWYQCREIVRRLNPIVRSQRNTDYKISTLTGIFYRSIFKAEDDVFEKQLKKQLSLKSFEKLLKYYEK